MAEVTADYYVATIASGSCNSHAKIADALANTIDALYGVECSIECRDGGLDLVVYSVTPLTEAQRQFVRGYLHGVYAGQDAIVWPLGRP